MAEVESVEAPLQRFLLLTLPARKSVVLSSKEKPLRYCIICILKLLYEKIINKTFVVKFVPLNIFYIIKFLKFRKYKLVSETFSKGFSMFYVNDFEKQMVNLFIYSEVHVYVMYFIIIFSEAFLFILYQYIFNQ